MRDTPHPLITDDGILERRSIRKLSANARTQHPALNAVLRIKPRDDQEKGWARELCNLQRSTTDQFTQLLGRSGWSQIGLDMEMEQGSHMEFNHNTIRVPVTISSLRGAPNDQILGTLREMVKSQQHIRAACLLLLPPDSALTPDEIREAQKESQLLLPPKSTIEQDGKEGRVLMPLAGGYEFAEENFDPDEMRHVLRDGKHGLSNLLAPTRLPEELKPGEFFLASVRGLSIGGLTGIIDRETNILGVEHLPARLLHGIRTTGEHTPRQIELINRGATAVRTDLLRIGIRFYPADREIRAAAARIITPQTLGDGVDIYDLVTPEEMTELLSEVGEQKEESAHSLDGTKKLLPYGLLVGRNRSAKIPWTRAKSFQGTHILQRAGRFIEARPEDKEKGWTEGQGIPASAVRISKNLDYIGGDQSKNKILATHAFCDTHVLNELVSSGISVFIARSLLQKESAWQPHAEEQALQLRKESSTMEADMRTDGLFFNNVQYGEFRSLEKRGAKIFLALKEMKDEMEKDKRIPAHVREFFRGLWVKPEAKERLKKIDTVIALYGSHVSGMEHILQPQLDKFMQTMKDIFGEKVAITHGKGPGVMKIADDAAAENDIPRIGVGICVEGQAGNCRPEAMIDFFDADRLTRQQLMDDLATFKLFNIGGAGTLEEAAITLCSQKLGKKSIAPIIFVDPLGLGQKGSNLWLLFKKQIKLLAKKKAISSEEIQQGMINIQLLQSYSPSYFHCVDSYDKAAKILKNFTNDPQKYYARKGIPAEAVSFAHQKEKETLEKTGFPVPHFFDKNMEYRLVKSAS